MSGKLQPEPVLMSSIPAKRSIWKKYLYIAASILIPLFCLGLGYFYSENKLKQNNDKMIVQVEIGQKVKMQLPDGTNVYLNSASSLAYDNTYNKKDRIIYLQGEAYFEVSKDKVRPFIVKTNDISVKALGTNFNVKAYLDDNYITTTLIEGSVQVNTPSQSEILAPNEKLTFYKDNHMISKSILQNTEKNTSWMNSQLTFDQERLEDMAKTLERMYNIRIHFASDKLKNIRFSGNVKNNNLENVLQLISFVSPIQYSMENDTTVIIRSK